MKERNGGRLWFTAGGQVIELWPFSQYRGASYPDWEGNESIGKPSGGFEQQPVGDNHHGIIDSSPEALAPSSLPSGIPDTTQ